MCEKKRLRSKLIMIHITFSTPFVNTSLSPTPQQLHIYIQKKTKKKTFCGFSMGSNQYWAGRVYDLLVYYMTGTPEGSTESGFMEKPGIEPATSGLQGMALIHYTTGASLHIHLWVKVQHFHNPKLWKFEYSNLQSTYKAI